MSLVEAVIDDRTEEPLRKEDLVALARSRSQVYGFLTAAYNRLPDDQFASSLSSPELAAFVAASTEAEDLDGEIQDGWRLINSFMRGCVDKPVEDLKTELAVERTRLLRGIKPGYGPPPPYEGVYASTAQEALGLTMMSVRNFYAECGVVLPEDSHEPPDYIGFELDFMRYLAGKEAAAWANGDTQTAMGLLEKEWDFLESHINTWVPRFCDLMFQEAQQDFYRGIARLTKSYVQGDASTVRELATEVRSVWAA